MSKRTIIIGVVAILAFVACIASLYFENRQTVKDAQDIINGEEPEVKPKAERKPKAQPEIINDNGTDNPEQTT